MTSPNPTLMETRYGRGRRASLDRRLAVGVGSILAVALIVFLVWAAFGNKPTASGTVDSFVATSNQQVDLKLTISNPTKQPVTCQVSATLANGSSVGSKQVKAAANGSTQLDLAITTLEPATGAIVDKCW